MCGIYVCVFGYETVTDPGPQLIYRSQLSYKDLPVKLSCLYSRDWRHLLCPWIWNLNPVWMMWGMVFLISGIFCLKFPKTQFHWELLVLCVCNNLLKVSHTICVEPGQPGTQKSISCPILPWIPGNVDEIIINVDSLIMEIRSRALGWTKEIDEMGNDRPGKMWNF